MKTLVTVSLAFVLASQVCSANDPGPGGAGTELKKIFARAGFVPAPDCICNATARIMDRHPAQWSAQNIQWIESRVQQAAPNLGVQYRPILVRQSIKLAIRRAARKGL